MGQMLSADALAIAANGGDKNAVKQILLVRGSSGIIVPVKIADIDATPLEFAVMSGHVKIARLLLKYTKIEGYENSEGLRIMCEALVLASSLGHAAIVLDILSTLPAEKTIHKCPHYNSEEPVLRALEAAVKNGHSEAVSAILAPASGIVPDTDAHMESKLANAVLVAIKHGRLGLLSVLVAAGANLNAKYGTTVISLPEAYKTGNVRVVQELVRLGADPTGTLRDAVQSGSCDIVIFLLLQDQNMVNEYTPSKSSWAPRMQNLLKELGHRPGYGNVFPTSKDKTVPQYKHRDAEREFRHVVLLSRGVAARIDWLQRRSRAEVRLNAALTATVSNFAESAKCGQDYDAIVAEEVNLLISQAEFDSLFDRRAQLLTTLTRLCEAQQKERDFPTLAVTAAMRDTVSQLDFSQLPEEPYSGDPFAPTVRRAPAVRITHEAPDADTAKGPSQHSDDKVITHAKGAPAAVVAPLTPDVITHVKGVPAGNRPQKTYK